MMQDAVRGGVFISVGCSFGSWKCVDVPGVAHQRSLQLFFLRSQSASGFQTCGTSFPLLSLLTCLLADFVSILFASECCMVDWCFAFLFFPFFLHGVGFEVKCTHSSIVSEQKRKVHEPSDSQKQVSKLRVERSGQILFIQNIYLKSRSSRNKKRENNKSIELERFMKFEKDGSDDKRDRVRKARNESLMMRSIRLKRDIRAERKTIVLGKDEKKTQKNKKKEITMVMRKRLVTGEMNVTLVSHSILQSSTHSSNLTQQLSFFSSLILHFLIICLIACSPHSQSFSCEIVSSLLFVIPILIFLSQSLILLLSSPSQKSLYNFISILLT
ncbi:hypothetical protein VP01_2229g1 [Puccinia sorghi]|uniref:Uncharacterized protein n=1 Tax=Puccinia sorghi TaxID=27349 RepID=A0A0L6V9B0_9BASI|nr:hypothetical protein VP01_2229g1 [Puccinia sorghi]